MARTRDRPELSTYYARIAAAGLAPLWERLPDLLPAEPRVRAVPHRWHYASLRPLLLEAGGIVTADEAERRVLILENPGLAGESAVTDSLFAGLQVIMPGEVAPSHRHTPAALRFILESDNAYTFVDGERIPMAPGDFIVTPSWTWHDHVHDGEAPVVWLDVLDLPAVRAIGPRFAEHYPEQRVPERARTDTSLYRYGMNMAPAGAAGHAASPLRYPYARALAALTALRDGGEEADPCHGIKLEYTDPMRGSAALPTISAFLQLLPAGFRGAPYRSTEGTIFCAVRGQGTVTAATRDAEVTLAYGPNDLIAIPCWCSHSFAADEESVLFSASDRALQTRLGLWREARG